MFPMNSHCQASHFAENVGEVWRDRSSLRLFWSLYAVLVASISKPPMLITIAIVIVVCMISYCEFQVLKASSACSRSGGAATWMLRIWPVWSTRQGPLAEFRRLLFHAPWVTRQAIWVGQWQNKIQQVDNRINRASMLGIL